MAYLIDNDYSSYILTEDEEIQGTLLTIAQKQVIQNEISIIATKLLDMVLDPAEPQKFIQEQSYIKGQLDALRYRLTMSETVEQMLAERASPDSYT